MTSRKLTSFLLAGSLAVASVGFASSAFALDRPVDTRLTSMDQMVDVPSSSWAYDAVRELVEKYDVIEGYQQKDGSFNYKGNSYVTRYEMAAALRDLLRNVDGGKVFISNGDASTINNLKNELAPEMAALEARMDRLEAAAASTPGVGNIKLSGDMVGGFVSDMRTGETNGTPDGVAALARLRLNVESMVVEDQGGTLGEGRMKARLVTAAGRNWGGLSGVSRIAADESANNESYFSNGSSTYRTAAYFDRLSYEQDFNTPGESKLTVFAGLVPWRDKFDKAAYRGDENTQFMNTSLTNTPGLATNITAAMLGVSVDKDLNDDNNLQLAAAFGSPNGANVLNRDFVATEARLNHNWANWDDRKTSVYAGGLFAFSNSASYGTPATGAVNVVDRAGNPFNNTNPAKTVYAGLSQEIYKGIGVSLGYSYNSAKNNSATLIALNPTTGNAATAGVRQAGNVALNIPTGTLGFRDGDVIGVGYALVDFQDSASTTAADRVEQVMETYYNFKVNDRLSVIPSFQLGSKLGGTNNNSDMAYALSLRAAVKF